MSDQDELLLSYHDSCLRLSDLELLEESGWLNDRLIGFAFEFFQFEQFANLMSGSSPVTLMDPSAVQLAKFCDIDDLASIYSGLNLPNCQLLLIPVNNNDSNTAAGGSHWSLAVFERSSGAFHLFDSMADANLQDATKIVRKIAPLVLGSEAKWTLLKHKCPQQQNGNDCGVFLIGFVGEILDNFSRHKQSDELWEMAASFNASEMRKLWKSRIVSLSSP